MSLIKQPLQAIKLLQTIKQTSSFCQCLQEARIYLKLVLLLLCFAFSFLSNSLSSSDCSLSSDMKNIVKYFKFQVYFCKLNECNNVKSLLAGDRFTIYVVHQLMISDGPIYTARAIYETINTNWQSLNYTHNQTLAESRDLDIKYKESLVRFIVKPWSKSKSKPCPNRTPSRIKVPQKKEKKRTWTLGWH